MTVSDNSSNLDYKGLISDKWDLDQRAYVRVTDTSVPHATLASVFAFGVVDSAIQNERNVHKSRKMVQTVTGAETVVDKYLGTAWDSDLKRFADEWTVSKTRASSSAYSPMSLFIGGSEVREHNPANWLKDDWNVEAWGTRTRLLFDDDLGLRITFVESVIAHSASTPAGSINTSYERRQVDAGRDILGLTDLGLGASRWTRTTWDTINYTFPAILATHNGDTLVSTDPANAILYGTSFEDANLRTVFQITVYVRPALSGPVEVEILEEMYTEAEAIALAGAPENTSAFGTLIDLGTTTTRARLFNPHPKDLQYDGLMVSFRVPNVVCDAGTITVTTGSDDEYYGPGVSDGFSWSATNITGTEYAGLVGEKVCIEDTVRQYKYGNFMRRRTFIKVV